jgi:hypothetical protein
MKARHKYFTALNLILLLICLSIFSACTFEKRRYKSGYYFENKSSSTRNQKGLNTKVVTDENPIRYIAIENIVPEKSNTEKRETPCDIKNNNVKSYDSVEKNPSNILSKPIIIKTTSILKEEIKSTNNNTTSASPPNPNYFIFSIGIAWLFGGFILFYFTRLYVGIISMIIGLVFIIISAIMKIASKDKADRNTKYNK